MAQPDPDLETLYRTADYVIDDAGVNLTIRMDCENSGLRDLLRERNASSWAFLTAYNPNSLPATAEQNADAQAELVRIVELEGYEYFHGFGTGEGWDPELSLFILDIPLERAASLGTAFGQSAILWGETDLQPILVWC